MDPSIMKLLEEDEDETMHSGADVEAFQAALNRDIGGDASTSQLSDLVNAATLSHESNQASTQSFMNWQATGQDSNTGDQSQQNVQHQLQQEQHALGMDLKDHGTAAENPEQHNDTSQELSHPLDHQKQSVEKFNQGQANQTSLQISQTSGIQISENSHPVSGIDKMQNSASESQSLKLQNAGHQQATGMEQAGNMKIPFMLLLPALKPHLDKDREMQLQTLFNKLRKNDIAKDQFVRHMKTIVGDQVLRMAVSQLQTQQGSNQPQLQSQTLAHQHNVRMHVNATTSQFTDSHSFNPPSAVQVPTNVSHQPPGNSALKPPELEHQVDMHAKPMSQMSSSSSSMTKQEREQSSNAMQGQNKQQQHFQFPQTSFPVYASAGSNYHPYSGTNVSASVSSVKPQSHDLQMRQMSHHQTIGVTQSGGPPQTMNMMSLPKLERQNHVNDPSRVQSGSISYNATKPPLQQSSIPWQAPINKEQTAGTLPSVNYVKQEPVEQAPEQKQKTQVPNPQGSSVPPVELGNSYAGNLRDESLEKQSSKTNFSTSRGMMPATSVSPSVGATLDANVQGSRIPTSAAGSSGRTPSKKPTGGQKKPLEALGSSPPPSSKKQKVSGAFLDQSIEQLNDVTAVSGVNLREEEEQLFSGSKEDSRVSEASRKVVQEEEERLILERIPLQKKLAEIMVKCGLKIISSDVERCLSLGLEERMRGLISNVIRVSKQRVDVEKSRHRTLISSDVRQQIMVMNQKAKEEWEKKQAEAEKLQKVNEPESENRVEGEKDKDEGRAKSAKVNKEEDDKMRTNAANVAARAAVGVDDMLSKWQLMAQARQKRVGGTDVATGSLPDKDAARKVLSGRSTKDNQEAERRGSATSASVGTTRKFGRNQVIVPQKKVARTISVKDVIAVLEREPQMSKSTLMYRLYERIKSDPPAE